MPKPKKIIIPVYYYIDEDNREVFDFDEMRDEFEEQLAQLEKSQSLNDTADQYGSMTSADIRALILKLKLNGGDPTTIQKMQQIRDEKLKLESNE